MRNRSHRGGNPARLIQALIGGSWEQANLIAGQRIRLNDFEAQMQALITKPQQNNEMIELRMPDEFKPFSTMPSCAPFRKYLWSRGFDWQQLRHYHLRYCTRGPFAGRVIIPIYANHKLVNWTGRSIHKGAIQRYKTVSAKQAVSITHFLLWQDHLGKEGDGTDTIYLCEGPFDSLKIRMLGKKKGITSTCFFTASPTRQQIDLLHEILPRFRHRYLLLDNEALLTTMQTHSDLLTLDIQPRYLPPNVKDPGELQTLDQLLAL